MNNQDIIEIVEERRSGILSLLNEVCGKGRELIIIGVRYAQGDRQDILHQDPYHSWRK
jgi:hypothetical protein